MTSTGGPDDILYGSPEQIGVVRRAAALRALLADDPRFSFQGRTVSLAGDWPDAADTVIALVRLQGYASAQFVPRARGEALTDAFAAAGLTPVIWDQYWGHDKAIAASHSFIEDFEAPEGVTLHEVMPDTPDETIHAICATSVGAGVLPLPGSAMRGVGLRGVFLYATGPGGEVIAVGGGSMAYHPESAYADEAFWGMLGTAEAWRGRRLACWVGAEAIVRLAERFGARGFSSGVKADNPASQAMCTRLGVMQAETVYAGATDPLLMGSGPVTR